jgi:DNA invertase Pin-like site-specific DNA recombinase
MSKILLMRESKTPKAIVGYTRVSTAAQAEDGVSLDAQHARIEAYAVAAGLPLSAIYSDRGISGAKASTRPELQRAISEACKRRGVLVVYSLSRLARSTRDAIEIADRLDRAGADLVSLTESIDTTSAAGRMIFRLLAVLAEFEADLTRERTRTALRHLRGQGRRVSGLIPYGSDLAADGSIVPNAQEQAGLAVILMLREQGLSLREIAVELEQRGIKTKAGSVLWSPKVLAATIRRADALKVAA